MNRGGEGLGFAIQETDRFDLFVSFFLIRFEIYNGNLPSRSIFINLNL